MNNPLAQQAQYYLNESSRLFEELNTEIEYSAVLEAVLEELVGTENFLKLITELGQYPDLDRRTSVSTTGKKVIGGGALNELSDATHTSYRKKATIDLAQRAKDAAVHGMNFADATARLNFGNPNSVSDEEVEGLGLEVKNNQTKIDARTRGLQNSFNLKPLGGQPLDMSKPKKEGPIAIRARTGAQRRLLGTDRPINSSYEPDLVQGIMNLLANSRNENALSEGQAKMLRMQDSAKRQQKRTGTVNPGLASDLDRAKKQNIIKSLGTIQLPGAMESGKDMDYIGTPHLQRLRVGERLTGMRPAGDDRSGLSHSLVSASRDTGNFHPDTDGAGGDVGHVDKVNRYGAAKRQQRASIARVRKIEGW